MLSYGIDLCRALCSYCLGEDDIPSDCLALGRLGYSLFHIAYHFALLLGWRSSDWSHWVLVHGSILVFRCNTQSNVKTFRIVCYPTRFGTWIGQVDIFITSANAIFIAGIVVPFYFIIHSWGLPLTIDGAQRCTRSCSSRSGTRTIARPTTQRSSTSGSPHSKSSKKRS
ncbi:hypothetical protein BC828DRAFT_157666 [Blastocladiella britannica]|nr:hypothetical protein BC828DRAFT_157666 [Blastocladiella britannica]